MLTRKYYERLARLIAESVDLRDFTERLIYFLKEDNPRFDPARFMLEVRKNKRVELDRRIGDE